MSIFTEHPTAEEYSAVVQANCTAPTPYILASEVLSEVEKRCGAGQQYTTFPNKITAEEKAKVEAKGYTVTENTIAGGYRDGVPDMYIGFQVALNGIAASGNRTMVISEKETNGGSQTMYGRSSDPKPTVSEKGLPLETGAIYIETDTGKGYMYNATDMSWSEV